MTTAYDIGDLRRCTVAFTDSSGAAADPTGITASVREPDGVVTSYVYGTDAELVRSGTGVYYVDWTIAKAGRHQIRFKATGTVTTAERVEFYARRKYA